MEDWKLDLTIVSAANLANVRNFGLMKVYAKVSINDVEELTYKSPVDYSGETNPVWNFKAPYNVPDKLIQGDDNKLIVRLYCERTFNDDKYVGGFCLPLKTLFDYRNVNGDFREQEYTNLPDLVGAIKVSYSFVEIVQATKADTSAQSSVVQVKETSIVSGLIQGAALSAAQGVAEMIFPGSSSIFELFR